MQDIDPEDLSHAGQLNALNKLAKELITNGMSPKDVMEMDYHMFVSIMSDKHKEKRATSFSQLGL